jgi:hypothetical protein
MKVTLKKQEDLSAPILRKAISDEVPFELTTGIPELVGILFQSRDITHLAHLSTDSYAAHMALDCYYGALLGHIDALVEMAQGLIGQKLNINIPPSNNVDAITHLQGILELVASATTESGAINNLLDALEELVATTLYKLKMLH